MHNGGNVAKDDRAEIKLHNEIFLERSFTNAFMRVLTVCVENCQESTRGGCNMLNSDCSTV